MELREQLTSLKGQKSKVHLILFSYKQRYN
jgi:hypothetical protein